MFETQLDEICLFPLQNKKNYFTFDDKKADEVKNFESRRRTQVASEAKKSLSSSKLGQLRFQNAALLVRDEIREKVTAE